MITIKTILCPVDFSETSKTAFRYACEFARSMGSKIVLLNVVEPGPIAVDMTLTYIPVEEDLAAAAKKDFVALVEDAAKMGIETSSEVIIGIPSEVILEKVAAVDADLVIMGSHGKTGLSRLLMGSVAEAVIRKAGVPVLIVKANEKEFISGE